MTDLLLPLAGIIGVVWAASEIIGRSIPKLGKDQVALLLGPMLGLIAHWMGFLALPGVEGWKAYVAAVFFGLIATAAAGIAHDKIAKPTARAARKNARG